jgi:hypothetical protein
MSKPMRASLLKTAMLLAFTTLSAVAVAADPPARVGRLAVTQGQVSIGGDVGGEMSPAQVNWPVTSGNTLFTAAGARTELRVGSTSIRLDGDSSLEVIELDDDSIRLRLHYGSASVRILNADVLRGFELITPQARVHLQQPGRVRVDAERVRDTSAVSVFDGTALVEAGSSQLTVRAGKRAEVGDDDMRTAGVAPDAFDSWSASRDRLEDKATSARYVTTEMTGYEDLDSYGSWRVDNEYGPLWTPTVASSWVPYRDGSWTWIDPWGWTWVDNAPWGYAPFHYGRWVYVNRHWAWAPGRHHERLVWAPALVGWVGGAGWNITFRDRSHRPGTGWYPLSPHDRYVPSWHASEEHLRGLNNHVRPDPHRGRDYRPQGLTVVPQDRFGPGGRVNVPRAPIATVAPTLANNGIPAASAPPAPPPNRPHRTIDANRLDRNHDGRPDRLETARLDQDGFARHHGQPQPVTVQQAPGQVQMPVPARPLSVTSPTPHMPAAPQPVVSPTPHVAPTPQPLTSNSPVIEAPGVPPGTLGWQRQERQERRDWDERRRERENNDPRRDGNDPRGEDRRGNDAHREHRPAPAPTVTPPVPAQPAAMMAAPQPAIEARMERSHRFEAERGREAPQRAAAPAPVTAPAPVAAPAPAPVARPAAPPPPPPQASAAPRPAVSRAEERRNRSDEKRQADR